MVTMTIDKNTGETMYYGNSTDTKPAGASAASKFFEYDTGSVYIFDGTTWKAI